MSSRPRVGISRCLLGDEVRYDGGHKREPSLLEALAGIVEWVPVCPEVEVGMGVPREPIELAILAPHKGAPYGASSLRLVGVQSGEDWTARMQIWAAQRLAELAGLKLSGFVLKARSPSCGLHAVPVRDGDPARGLFADALVRAMPGLPVEDEERLRDSDVRAQFVAELRAYRSG